MNNPNIVKHLIWTEKVLARRTVMNNKSNLKKKKLKKIVVWFFLSKWKTALLKCYVHVWKWRVWEVAKEACLDKSAALRICHFNACVLLIIWLFERLSRKKHNNSWSCLDWSVGGDPSFVFTRCCVVFFHSSFAVLPKGYTVGRESTSSTNTSSSWGGAVVKQEQVFSSVNS